MGALRETLSILWAILTSRWYWIIITVTSAIVITPFVIILTIISIPAPWNFVGTILLVIAWGVVAGYKDWIIAKAKEEKPKIKG